jgi:type IV pilus assembly protein PilM
LAGSASQGTGGFRRARDFWAQLNGAASGTYVALDVGSSAVKLLEVRGPADNPEILRAGIAPVPEGALQNNAVHDIVAVARVIRGLAESLGIRSRQVITAVPGPAVIIKKARVTLRPEDDLEALLMVEAANFIPESLDNVSLDYQVLRAEDSDVEVLLVAVRKDILSGFTMAISDAGLEPTIVDVDYFALENMFELNYDSGSEDVVGLINIGARYSSINIVRGGVSSTTGDVQAGGSDITDALVRFGGLSREDAEKAQNGEPVAGHPDQKIRDLIVNGATELADAINQSLRFLWRTASDEPMRAIYVAGGGSRVPGLIEKLGEKLDAPVELANPFARVNIGRSVDAVALEGMAPSLAVAVGLSTRRPGDA